MADHRQVTAARLPPFAPVIGILGHPTTPRVTWTDAEVAAMRAAGFDTLQLSIAWASRPANEALNLEHLDDEANRAEWRRRSARAREHGLRTLAHFGLPVGPQTEATTCILDPAVRDGYARRLERLGRDVPGIDDVLIYTYDQLAWLCSEFGECPRCRGIPLHERLTPFLEAMVKAARTGNPGCRLWWEPWELSAGQTYAIASHTRPEGFGLALHHSIAEVQFVGTTDLWFRTLARLAAERGIPVVGEGFFSGAGEDIHPSTHLACPRLVWQQLDALRRTVGVCGVKEYYGIVPEHASANLAMFSAYLRQPEASLAELTAGVAAAYGPTAATALPEAWEETALAMEIFPWDASWALRRLFDGTRSGDGRAVPGASWLTPSWQSNRRGYFLVTDAPWQHPWLREDVGLRAVQAAERFARAAAQLERIAPDAGPRADDVRCQAADAARAARVAHEFGTQLLAHRHE
jgi:hypothetical protein